MKIEGKTIIVTGGASGLGLDTAKRLIKEKANVVLVDVNQEAGDAAEKDLGKNALFVKADITDEASVKALVKKTVEKFGAVHGAVNCAGVAFSTKVVSSRGVFPLDAFERVMKINVTGTFNIIRLVAEAMVKQTPDASTGERGVFINVASVAAYDGQQGQAAYSASKAGVVGMTLPIAREFAPLGIRVVTIAPGTFDTPMMAKLPEQTRAQINKEIPFPSRMGFGHEFADLAAHIITNTYLNGETIRLDGALRLAKL
eukprot:TRINITY_DN1646_c0_g1_i1.p1 TRINITY_DN1646_c0_g1~~TRINITY_DN1646_c0_g1_i1.p1  ORF type:complete len:266 (-),score=108.15 TRINITY_DN1646_c0_g1_i1:32-802(-)